MNAKELFRKLPKVDILLQNEVISGLCEEYGRGFVVECIRAELDHARALIAAEVSEAESYLNDFVKNVEKRVKLESEYPLRKVINATGIILHTNLGRAPLGKVHLDAISQAICGYSNLEYDLETGKRGKRFTHYADLISKIAGTEGAIAVNNNAASLTLIFGALSKGKEVIVSRGEAIEIGGKFRIPEVIEQSGAILKEVGTTNKTRISDYEDAINENTGALLKVHTSNYKVIGFTEEVTLEQLVELGEKYNLPVIMDVGSGVLVDLEKYGLAHEPTVQEQVKKGADLVCFSGDKLLGGPQAGIIVGKKEAVQKLEHYPLMRAIRLDKCAIAALAATFKEYLDETRAVKNIPVLHMIARTILELKEQAEELAAGLSECAAAEIQVEESESMVGGGSLPGEILASYAVTIQTDKMSCEALMEKMRAYETPIIGHIKEDKVWLDMRTVMPEDIKIIQNCLNEILR